MAHIYRLIAACLLLWCGAASALIPLTPAHYEWGWNNPPAGPIVLGWTASPQTACTNFFPYYQAWLGAGRFTGGFTAVDAVPSSPGLAFNCWATLDGEYKSVASLYRSEVEAACPANSTPSGSQCQCAAGYAELSGNSCVVDNGCTTVLGLTPPNSGACIGGSCQYGYKVAAGEAATAQPYGRFADRTIVVMGRSINIAFSMICQYLEALGLVMVGVASLLALRIVTRG
jgi:hypothetical protein